METVKLSPKYQTVIPKSVRSKLQLAPGQTIQVMAYGHRIELIPVRNVGEMQGYLKGINPSVEREADRV